MSCSRHEKFFSDCLDIVLTHYLISHDVYWKKMRLMTPEYDCSYDYGYDSFKPHISNIEFISLLTQYI